MNVRIICKVTEYETVVIEADSIAEAEEMYDKGIAQDWVVIGDRESSFMSAEITEDED